MHVYAFTCGWLTMSLGAMLEGEEGQLEIPVPSYLIDHPKGRALFDSGLHPIAASDPASRYGGLANLFEFRYQPDEHVAARLEALEVDPTRIDLLVNSHLHFDHAGGNELVPNADLVIQRREWEAAHDADLIATNGYQAQDYDHGHRLRLIDGEADLFGDGTVRCIPTYGHTPGHQSLHVKGEGGELLLCGDACYLRRTLENLHLPRIVHDRDEMLASLGRIRALRDAGARICYGHDPEFWETVPQAPTPLL